MAKPFLPSFLRRGTLYPLRVKSEAVQHAMLVHFLLLLCAHKEVVLIKKQKGPPQTERALCITLLEITLVRDGSNFGIAVASVNIRNQTTAGKI